MDGAVAVRAKGKGGGMTKAQVVERLALECGFTKKFAGEVISGFLAIVAGELCWGGRFAWPRFGVWQVATRKSRRIRNPQTEKMMRIPTTVGVRFRASKELKRLVRATNKRPRAA